MNLQFMFVWENLRNIISSPHKTCLCVFVSFLCVSMSVSRPEGYRVFLSLFVCFLWSVYVVAKIIVVGFTSQIIFESSPGTRLRVGKLRRFDFGQSHCAILSPLPMSFRLMTLGPVWLATIKFIKSSNRFD